VPLQVHRDSRSGLPHWCGLGQDRTGAGLLRKAWDGFRYGSRPMAVSFESRAWRLSQKPGLLVTLSLTFSAVPAPSKFPEGFLAWLAILAGTLWLMILLRGRSSRLAWVAKKAVKVGLSVCLLYGFWMLMNWKLLWVVLGPLGLTRRETGFWLMLGAILIWWVSVLWILFSRRRRQQGVIAENVAHPVVHQAVSVTAGEVHPETLHPAAPKPLGFREGRNSGGHGSGSGRPRRNRRRTDRTINRYLN
jgi:hypothetical protein